jgi:putative DNA primase/helicase
MTHAALEFLKFLDPSEPATYNIEVYADVMKGAVRPKPDLVHSRWPNLTLVQVRELIPDLESRNNRGGGVFVAVNQCQGQRSKDNIVRIRGVHADLDGVSQEQIDAIRQRLEPTIEVQSSGPLNCHFYWLLNEGETLSHEDATAINAGLVGLGADIGAKDISRLLRLPGFKHMKNRSGNKAEADLESRDLTPLVHVRSAGLRYTAAQIETALPKEQPTERKRAKRNKTRQKTNPSASAQNYDDFAELIEKTSVAMAEHHRNLWEGRWKDVPQIFSNDSLYPSQSEADLALASHIAQYLARNGAPQECLVGLSEVVFGKSALAERDKWQERPDYRQTTIERACDGITTAEGLNKRPVRVDWSTHGDLRTARLFADIWRKKLVYTATRRHWLKWSEERWNWCSLGEEIECAKATSTALYQAAGQVLANDQDKGPKCVRDAIKAHNLPQINAMLKLAQSEPEMAIKNTDLDSDAYLLGVENGVINLRNSMLMDNKPERYITRYCPVVFDTAAQCPRWMQFLDEVFKGDAATIASVQRLLGYTLTGLSQEEIIVFCVGFGANGKSIFSNIVSAILGDHGETAPSTLLAARRADDNSARGDLAMLDGVRLVSINELPGGLMLDEVVVKQIAGREPISARYMYGEFFTYQPKFTPWVRTNHKPIIKGDDDGVWRRIVVLPFRRKFEEHEQDQLLEAALLKECDGILSWMVKGAALYLKSGLNLSPTILAEQKQYRKESDLLGEFLDEKTDAGADKRVSQSDLFYRWQSWNENNGTRSGSKKSFTQRLAERGFTTAKSDGKYTYLGLGEKY